MGESMIGGSDEQQVLAALRDWLAQGEAAWLCTIVEVSGSSPRPLGALMACRGDGLIAGSLSGGCVEEDLVERLGRGEMAQAQPELLTYGLSAEQNERLGLPCGGRLVVLVEPCARVPHQARRTIAGCARRAPLCATRGGARQRRLSVARSRARHRARPRERRVAPYARTALPPVADRRGTTVAKPCPARHDARLPGQCLRSAPRTDRCLAGTGCRACVQPCPTIFCARPASIGSPQSSR